MQEFAEATVGNATVRSKVASSLDAAKGPILQYCSTLNGAARLIPDSSDWCPLILLELGQCYLYLARPAFAIACFEKAQRFDCVDSGSRLVLAALSLRARLLPFWRSYLDEFFGRSHCQAPEQSSKKPPSEITGLRLVEKLRGHAEAVSPAYGIACCELARLSLVSGSVEAARRHALEAASETLCPPQGRNDVVQILAICDLIDGSPESARRRLYGIGRAGDASPSDDLALTHRLIAESFKAQGMWKDALHHMDKVQNYLSNRIARYAARIEAPYFLQKDLQLPSGSAVLDQTAQLAQSILLYINQNLSAALTVNSIAAALGVPAKEIARVVHLTFGVRLRLMIEERRMMAARTALKSNGVGCYSIREVGENVGIRHPSTFARRYKYWFNELPADTRKRSA